MTGSRAIAIGLMAALLGAPAAAEVYRWRDADGREHFTTELHRVPARYRDQAEQEASRPRGTVNRSQAPAAPAPEPAAVPEPGGAGAADPVEGERIAGRSEAEWRQRAAGSADRIRELETVVLACGESPLPGAEFDSNGQRRIKRQHAERQRAAADRCSEARFQLDAARRADAKMRENARTRGVPPGWLR